MARSNRRIVGQRCGATPVVSLNEYANRLADRLHSRASSEQFYQAAGSADKTLKLYDGGYHDLLNDTDRELVMRDILSWLDTQLAR